MGMDKIKAPSKESCRGERLFLSIIKSQKSKVKSQLDLGLAKLLM